MNALGAVLSTTNVLEEADAATFAAAANGVTGGDAHDHSGGDGAQIAYGGLSGIPSTFAPSAHATSHKSGGGDAVKLDELAAPTGSVGFNDQQATSFRIENRTSDPITPTVGQIWLRTDL